MKQEWLLTYIIFMSAEKGFMQADLCRMWDFLLLNIKCNISDFYTQYSKG